MRHIKLLGLIAMATVTGIAFVGTSAASADTEHIVVCGKAELICENPLVTEVVEGKEVAQIHGTAKEPKLLTSLGTVTCGKSLANISVLNTLGKSLLGHLTELTFTECKLGKTKCEEVKTLSLGDISFTKIGALEASAKSNGGTKVKVKCGALIDCTYGGEPLLKAHSSESGETKLLATKTTVLTELGEKFICPDTSEWDATYPASGTMWIES
ncbi:MAG TPA: hypothetical protein VF245_07800 [Solirubrobacterales bacterium]